jgi:hypothetical protein
MEDQSMEQRVRDNQHAKIGDEAQDSSKGSSKGSSMGAPEPAQTQSAAIAKRFQFQCGVCRKTDGHNRTTCPLLRTLWAREPAGWGKIAAGTCSLSNRGRTVTRLGDAAHPRAYARSRLPAEGTCTIDVALDKLQPGGNAISVGVVHAGRVGEQPLEALGACQKEAGISWRNASAKSRGRIRSRFGGQDVSADNVCGALKEGDVVSVTWDGNTRAVWWALNSSATTFGPLTLPPGEYCIAASLGNGTVVTISRRERPLVQKIKAVPSGSQPTVRKLRS